jgi:4-hydroxy-2-oxoheptanedioate aldolase
MLAASLKARLRKKQLTVGPMMTYHSWPGYLEMFKAEGMHFAILDLEHGSASLPMVEEQCRVARLLDFPLIIRPEASSYYVLRKYIDMGPAGFMIPWTERKEQLDALRDAVFTPPKGRRGPGGPAIAHNRSIDRAGWNEIEANLCLIPQIETPAGIAQLPGLVDYEWIDATMLGPYDLALNLDLCWEPQHPDLVAAIQKVHDKSAEVGKPSGMVVSSKEQVRFWMERGFHFFIYGDAAWMVREGCRRIMDEMKELNPDADR